MNANRRDILKASLGAGVGAVAVAMLPGCQTRQQTTVGTQNRPGIDFGPRYGGNRTVAATPPSPGKTVAPIPAVKPPPTATTTTPPPETTGPVSLAGLDIQPRRSWTHVTGPISEKHNPMGEVRHITVHHEGWQVVDFTDAANTIERLEKIRGAHTRSVRDGGRGWADIGYHFVIDRAGRIWEGRSIKLQGAHVSECNENNLGIMCLGNFEDQVPSAAQLAALTRALKAFKAYYKVPMDHIYTHQEWAKMGKTHSTECPGRNLQAQMGKIRKSSVIG